MVTLKVYKLPIVLELALLVTFVLVGIQVQRSISAAMLPCIVHWVLSRPLLFLLDIILLE